MFKGSAPIKLALQKENKVSGGKDDLTGDSRVFTAHCGAGVRGREMQAFPLKDPLRTRQDSDPNLDLVS